jgi:hypothetical protein
MFIILKTSTTFGHNRKCEKVLGSNKKLHHSFSSSSVITEINSSRIRSAGNDADSVCSENLKGMYNMGDISIE